ncbi:hypothetical protein A0U89_14020 (plasmid) [Kozakia baliensis]|uniref:Uncharacterized protein n=2 Tax=Kozakia baliensis TaxID=153496 RepID=A0A1D8UXS2_9PROT|nr:hypothetical protein [Kozakia baliensis]AOX18430.1 hypothetical protein A0U89_14020 [Kozakia baliensis]
MSHAPTLLLLALLLAFPIESALAQSETSSSGCAALTQAAQKATDDTIQANDNYVKQPQSVGALSCLDGFLHGTGLNVVSSGLDPASLLQNLENQLGSQLCQAAQSAWGGAMGGTQCSLSLTGVNLGLGFGNIGSGTMCPTLSWGGNGPPLAQSSVGSGGNSGLYVNGTPELPAGYSLTSNLDGVF